jgi:hypothetical protein
LSALGPAAGEVESKGRQPARGSREVDPKGGWLGY